VNYWLFADTWFTMTVSICVNGLSAPFAKSVACETNKCTPMDDFSVQGVLTHHPLKLKYLRIIFLVNFSSVILRKLLSVLGVSRQHFSWVAWLMWLVPYVCSQTLWTGMGPRREIYRSHRLKQHIIIAYYDHTLCVLRSIWNQKVFEKRRQQQVMQTEGDSICQVI